MSYQSPIEIFQTQMRSQIEDEIYKAVMKVDVNVDKNELLKALQYDRGQYQKGYADRDSEIVRCNQCKHYDEETGICNLRHVHGCAETWKEQRTVTGPLTFYIQEER